MPLQLPPEVLDQIFAFIRTSSDIPSLRACFQVNPMFASLVEPHIWYHLTIENLGIKSTGHSPAIAADIASPSFSTELASSLALQLLIAKPQIASFVRSLTISIGSLGNLRWYMTRSLGDEDIARVLPLLPHLERVVLSDRGYGKIYWGGLDGMVKDAFVRALGRPSLREVGILRIEQFPLEVLGTCSSLERLVLEGGFTFGSQTATPSQPFDLRLTMPADSTSNPNQTNSSRIPSSMHRAHLKSLSLQHCTASMQFIVAWFYSSNLESRPDIRHLIHLKATVRNPRDYEYLPFILDVCKSSLEELELDPGGEANLLHNPGSHQYIPVSVFPLLSRPPLLFRPNVLKHLFEAAPTEFKFQVSNISSVGFDRLSTITVCMPDAFSLSALSVLKHLRLQLRVEEDEASTWANGMDTRYEDPVTESYGAPFTWVKRVCDELAAPSSSAHSQLGTQSRGPSMLSLERLELDITFSMEPANASKVSWAPLADVLSSLSSFVPSLKLVKIRVLWAGTASATQAWPTANEGTEKKGKSLIVRILEDDPHLGVFVRQGLLKIMDG